MSKEQLGSIGEKITRMTENLPGFFWGGVFIGIYMLTYVPFELYVGIRGRFSRAFKEEHITDMVGSAMASRIDYSGNLGLRFWRKEDSQLAEEAIRAGMEWHDERDEAFNAMSDEEMAAYVGNHARQLRYMILPAMAEGERRDN